MTRSRLLLQVLPVGHPPHGPRDCLSEDLPDSLVQFDLGLKGTADVGGAAEVPSGLIDLRQELPQKNVNSSAHGPTITHFLYGAYVIEPETNMAENRLTRHQVEAGEHFFKGTGDRSDAALWARHRNRLRDWQVLLDLSVREALLAAVENEDPYILYELAREAVGRMEPWMRVLLQRDLQRLLREGAGVGAPFGTFDAARGLREDEAARPGVPMDKVARGLRSTPQAIKLLHFLNGREKWNERTELKPEAKEKIDFPAHRTTKHLGVLEEEGAVRRWTEEVRSGGRGRPRRVRWVALTPLGRGLVAVLKPPQLGPGGIREERHVRPTTKWRGPAPRGTPRHHDPDLEPVDAP